MESIIYEETICKITCLDLYVILSHCKLPGGLILEEYCDSTSFNIVNFNHRKFDSLSISYPPLANIKSIEDTGEAIIIEGAISKNGMMVENYRLGYRPTKIFSNMDEIFTEIVKYSYI